MEVIVATVVAVVAILALAYTFGTARGLVNRYETARVALAAAQRRMETLSAGSAIAADLQPGQHQTLPVEVDGTTVAFESWTVTLIDDPATPTHAGDLKRVVVTVAWGGRSPGEQLALTRIFPLH